MGIVAGTALCGACLEPFDEGEPLSEPPFRPASAEPETAPRVDAGDRPFTQRIVRLTGFEAGERVGFLRADGAVSDLIAPAFRVFVDGEPGLPIVDALPGDPGYSPLWRVVRADTTDAYNGEQFWSREAILAGVAFGLLELAPQGVLVLAPLVHEDVRVEGFEPDTEPTRLDVWYRDQKVPWIRLPAPETLANEQRAIAPRVAYDLQRVNESFRLDEDLEGFDLDGDGGLASTHRVFEASSSPICRVSSVRTVDGLNSIDSEGSPDLIDATSPDFLPPGTGLVLSITQESQLEMCPRWEDG